MFTGMEFQLQAFFKSLQAGFYTKVKCAGKVEKICVYNLW